MRFLRDNQSKFYFVRTLSFRSIKSEYKRQILIFYTITFITKFIIINVDELIHLYRAIESH